MSSENQAILNQVFSSVLEQLAFMFVDAAGKDSPKIDAAGIVQTRMGFQGPFSGHMELIVPRGMCEELAANVLGLEPDDEVVLRAPFDALKELLNVTCGNVLTRIAGDQPVFDLTIPTVEQYDADQWDAFRTRDNTLFVLVDDHPVLLYLEQNEVT